VPLSVVVTDDPVRHDVAQAGDAAVALGRHAMPLTTGTVSAFARQRAFFSVLPAPETMLGGGRQPGLRAWWRSGPGASFLISSRRYGAPAP
jgi:hypothetical protein